MRLLLAIAVLSAGCAGVEPAIDSDVFEPINFHMEGAGRVSYRLVVEGGPDTLCSWRQASDFRQARDDEAAGFRAIFRNGTPDFASWNLGTRGDRVLYGEHDMTIRDYLGVIAHATSVGINGTGQLEVWFSYGALDWTHDSSLTCQGPPESVRWFRMEGVLWDANTLEGGPVVNQLVGGHLARAQVTIARDYGTDLRVEGELIGTLFSRDAPGQLEITGPSPKQMPLGPGVHWDLWTGDAGDYALRWDAAHAGTSYTLTGALLDATEVDPSAIPGFANVGQSPHG